MPGLVRGMARTAVIAGTTTAVSNNVSRRQARRWAGQDQQRYAETAPQQQYAPSPPAAEDPTVAQLQELAGLRDQGILTEEEFAAKKRQILAIQPTAPRDDGLDADGPLVDQSEVGTIGAGSHVPSRAACSGQ